ncbi:MAG TPA: VOC family protein [bacterium]|nr:VOC family protein [bacterium]
MAETPLDPRATVGHVHLRVADLDRALDFYRDALGFREAWRGGQTVMLSADGGYPFALGLTGTADPPQAPRRRCGLYHAAFLLPGRAELGRLLRRLLEREVVLDGASDHLVSEALYLHDPEGNGVELYADRPREQWGWHGDEVQMDTRQLDLRDLLAAGGDRSAPAAAGTRLGHVHLRVSDLGRAEAFYHGALGFDVVLRRYSGALFLSAGGYHHHLGTNVWAGQGIPPAATAGPGLWYFSVALPTRDGLETAAARLASHDRPPGSVADCGPCLGAGVADRDGILTLLTADHSPLPERLTWAPPREPLGVARVS